LTAGVLALCLYFGLKVDELEEIDQALNRIEMGEYGRCIDCGKKINKERLKIMPYADQVPGLSGVP